MFLAEFDSSFKLIQFSLALIFRFSQSPDSYSLLCHETISLDSCHLYQMVESEGD